MSATRINDRLYSWASEIDDQTLEQAKRTAELPIVAGHVALMPDAHLGKGATIGSVIPTKGAVMPAAVGVDIGCGMIAAKTTLRADQLPSLDGYLGELERVVPAGLGHWFSEPSPAALAWYRDHPCPVDIDRKQEQRLLAQLGTMGSGNHFFEVCRDEHGDAWVIMHSGSRGIGNQLATRYTKIAEKLCDYPVPDRELAWLQEATPEFDEYILAVRWSQGYALENRRQMMDHALAALFAFVGAGREIERERVNCHHNFVEQIDVDGERVWLTRKGAIRAAAGDAGLIPGSMGGMSYVVRGLGSALSYESCAHGAGRRMSRTQARKRFTPEDLERAMAGVEWQRRHARDLVDEAPMSYKDIDRVMADQADLVEVVHELKGLANYKGTS